MCFVVRPEYHKSLVYFRPLMSSTTGGLDGSIGNRRTSSSDASSEKSFRNDSVNDSDSDIKLNFGNNSGSSLGSDVKVNYESSNSTADSESEIGDDGPNGQNSELDNKSDLGEGDDIPELEDDDPEDNLEAADSGSSDGEMPNEADDEFIMKQIEKLVIRRNKKDNEARLR